MEQLESKLVSVKVYDKSRCNYVFYKKERAIKIFSKIISYKPEGFYTESDRFLGDSNDLLNGAYYVNDCITGEKTRFILVVDENNKAYYRPYVKLQFESGRKTYAYFSTIELCRDYIMRIHCKYPDLIDVDDFSEI